MRIDAVLLINLGELRPSGVVVGEAWTIVNNFLLAVGKDGIGLVEIL